MAFNPQEPRDMESGATAGKAPHMDNFVLPCGVKRQFLHAHYYERRRRSKAQYAKYFEDNKSRRESALSDAISWWKRLIKAPNNEDEMLNVTAPFLRRALLESSLEKMDEETFREICMGVHSIKDYARRVPNRAVLLPENGTHYSIPQKVSALSSACGMQSR